MYDIEEVSRKWAPVLEHGDYAPIKKDRVAAVATLLENQHKDSMSQNQMGQGVGFLGEAAPANSMGASSSVASDGAVDIFDPVLISLVRRSYPNLMTFDIMGTQPMTGPTGIIFAMRSLYNGQSGAEALFNEANTSFSASASGNTASIGAVDASAGTGQVGSDPTRRADGSGYTVETGMSTAQGEALGDSGQNAWQEMGFKIDKVTATAVERALKAEYTVELAQDLKAIHGLSAEKELSDILSAEILAEINREAVRTINYTASAGAQRNTATAGTFDLDVDSNGRWSVERFKGLIFQIERDCNEIAKATRRGKGNILVCGSDVASALQMAGVLDYSPKLSADLNVDDTGNTFAGVMNGRIRVFVDPYFSTSNGDEYYTVGYKGSNSFDAGLFYCPYVPLQKFRAVGENNFQPKIGFKTRYAMVANPFATTAGDGIIDFNKKNVYYRTAKVKSLM